MRFKLLPIFAALLLLCGCGGARTLADVSGCGQWSRVQIIEWYEQGGSAGTQLPADSRDRILTIKKFRPSPDRQVFVKQLILRMA